MIRKRGNKFTVAVYDPRVKGKMWVGTYATEEEAQAHEEMAAAYPHIHGYGENTCQSQPEASNRSPKPRVPASSWSRPRRPGKPVPDHRNAGPAMQLLPKPGRAATGAWVAGWESPCKRAAQPFAALRTPSRSKYPQIRTLRGIRGVLIE